MSVAVIQQRLLFYQLQTINDQENALKEITQEIALMALSRAGFFKEAVFQGGTCLRILYGLERFSEDLDFVLKKSNRNFSWHHYINNMNEEFSAYGFTLEVYDREKLDNDIKIAFLKANSEGGILIIKDNMTNKPKLKIKLEIDTNPPAGSNYELKYLDFPLPYSVTTQDLPSLFAGKCHALLCRKYIKGRDWYDFVWYVSRRVMINFSLLNNAIQQTEKSGQLTQQEFFYQLKVKINSMDWETVKKDVARFLRQKEMATLDLWSKKFFLSRLDKLSGYLTV